MAGFVFPFFVLNDEKYGKLRRQDLMDLVLMRSREVEDLKVKLENLTRELEERKIIDAGSETIADAAMRRGQIYQLAHEIADSYVDSVRLKTQEQAMVFEREKKSHYQELTQVENEVNDLLLKKETEINALLLQQEEDSNHRIQRMEEESRQRIAVMEAESQKRMALREAEVKERIKKKEDEVHSLCEHMLDEARANSQKYWDDIQNQIKNYMSSQKSFQDSSKPIAENTLSAMDEQSCISSSPEASESEIKESMDLTASPELNDNIPEEDPEIRDISSESTAKDNHTPESQSDPGIKELENVLSGETEREEDAEQEEELAAEPEDIKEKEAEAAMNLPMSSVSDLQTEIEENKAAKKNRSPRIEVEASDLDELENLIVISN